MSPVCAMAQQAQLPEGRPALAREGNAKQLVWPMSNGSPIVIPIGMCWPERTSEQNDRSKGKRESKGIYIVNGVYR